jgi:hypothetical protein
MINELKKQFTEIKSKIKGIDKKAAVDEYLKLIREKTEIEAELASEKSKLYAHIAKEKSKLARRKSDHEKFILGGIVKKYYENISADEFEKKLIELRNYEKDITVDMERYFKN